MSDKRSDPQPIPAAAYEPADAERAASAEQSALLDSAPRHDPYAALRLRDFRLYSCGWLFATIAYQMQSAAIGWELYQRTRSAMSLGIFGGVQAIPLILLALPAGQLADRMDRKRIAMSCAVLTAICSAALAVVSVLVAGGCLNLRTWEYLLYGLILIGAVISTFTRPARAALLPQIVPARIFSNAVTWNTTIFEVSSMSGPAIAGGIIALAAPRAVYIIAAIFNVFFFAFLFLMRHRPAEPAAPRAGKGELIAGIRFVWRTKIILGTITLDLFAVLLGGATYLLPMFAKDILHVGPVGFGWLRAAPAIGACSMALFQAHRTPLSQAGRTLLLAVAGFGVATIVFGFSRWFWVSLIALYFTGALDNISVVVRHTLVQLMTPDSMRGRVSAVNAVFIGASNEIGGLESGLTAWAFGPIISVVVGGIGTILVVIAVALIWPQVRRIGSLQDVHPPEEQLEPAAIATADHPRMDTNRHELKSRG